MLQILRRGEDEREGAELLSSELQGLPLAIVHYAGLIGPSHIPLSKVLETFLLSKDAADNWSTRSSQISLLYYERTLETVWDRALEALAPDSLKTLQVMAYLYADDIPETMLFDSHTAPKLPVAKSVR